MVGVSGFEPEASWTRTKRDTKLRHTPIALILYAQTGAVSRENLVETREYALFLPNERDHAVFYFLHVFIIAGQFFLKKRLFIFYPMNDDNRVCKKNHKGIYRA